MARPEIVGKVVERILRAIASGSWPAGTKLPPARRLMAQLGVGRRTVMAAVRRVGEMGLLDVGPRRAVRVRPAAEAAARRRLAPGPESVGRRRVAILISDIFRPLTKNTFYHTLVTQIEKLAEDYNLETSVIWWPLREQLAVAELLLRTGFAGAICVGFRPGYAVALSLLHEAKFPLVLFNQEIPGLKIPAVSEDLYGAAQRMASHLFHQGHRNLCLVTHPLNAAENAAEARDRLGGMAGGWGCFLTEQNLLASCTIPVYTPWQYLDNIYDHVFRSIMRGPDRPTALVFAYSPWAELFLQDKEFSHFKVPDELSLATLETTAGIAGVPWCPPLTNMEINHVRTAECLLETVRKMLDGDLTPPNIRVALALNLTDSVGPAPASATPQKARRRGRPPKIKTPESPPSRPAGKS